MRIKVFHFGEWLVDANSCTLTHDQRQQPVKAEPRAMDVLVALCSRPGEILSAEDLLRSCWDGLAVGDNQVHKAIAQLRKLLGDDPGHVRYIENIRKRGYRTVAPVTALAEAAGLLSPSDWSEGSPFVGLDAFDESRAAVFFGRDTAIMSLRETLLRQAARGGLVLVLGASGSGKTSLIKAGLLPALRRPEQPFRLVDTTMLDMGDVSGLSLLTAAGGALLDLEVDGEPLLDGQSAESVAALLADRREDAVPQLFNRVSGMGPQARVLLFVDRLEAIFNNPAVDEGQRRGFLIALDRLARSGTVLVVAACRNDFYPDVAREPVLMAAKAAGAHFDLAPPTRAEIMQMIRMPALAAGLSFGVDEETRAQLDDILCDGTADNPDALPLLQYTLHELYLQRSTSRELTVAAYRTLGGIGGAIGKRAEATLNELPELSRHSLPQVLSLIVTMGGGDGTARSRRMPWSALSTDSERILVRTFVQQRLFVSLVYDGEPVFGVAHEAMLRQWPRVTAWIAQHRQALNVRARLEESVRRWVEEGRRADLLLPRGKRLEEARELTRQMQIPLSGDVRAFIADSMRRERRADQRRFVVSLGFGLVALVALLLGLRANQAEDMAERRRRQAEDLMNFMVGDFADKLRPLGRLDLLSDVSGKALSYFGNSNIADLSPEARMQQARALQTIAEVARARGEPEAARDALLLAKKLLDANLAEGVETLDLLKDLGADAFWLGQIALDKNNLDEAQSYFKQYEQYSVRMNDIAPDNVDAWMELSYARNSLGSVDRVRGDNKAAATHFQSSLELKRRAMDQRPDDRGLRAELADSLSWLGSVREAVGDLREALLLYEQEQVELRSLRTAAPSEFRWTYDLVTALHRHARLLDAMGRDVEADAAITEGQALARSLVLHDPSNRIWQHAMLRINWLAGTMWVQRRPLESVLVMQKETAEKLAALARENTQNAIWRQVEIANNISIGETLLRMGRLADARDHLKKVLRADDAALRDDTGSAHYLALGFVFLSETETILGNSGEAHSACQQAVDLLHPIIAVDERKFSVQDAWVRANVCLGAKNQVRDTINWLQEIGYRRKSYVQFLSGKP